MYTYLMLPAEVRAEVPAIAAERRDRRRRGSRGPAQAAAVRRVGLQVTL